MTILLDAGHAAQTKGKRKQREDGTWFYEYQFSRDIERRICNKLDALNISYIVITPEDDVDIPLSRRAERANEHARALGKNNCLFISIHSNAAGDGTSWKRARGFSAYTSKGYTKSDEYAEIFMKEAETILPLVGGKARKYCPEKWSWEEDFTVLKKTICPAVLTENLFYDNKEDLAILDSEEGKEAIAQIHINSIIKIIKDYQNR